MSDDYIEKGLWSFQAQSNEFVIIRSAVKSVKGDWEKCAYINLYITEIY